MPQPSFAPVLTMARGDRPPLFCVHPAAGVGLEYATLVPHLGQNRPVYALQAPGLDGGAPPGSIGEAAAGFLRRVREILPSGPPHLLGWSYGGMVAHAMAVRLRAAGEPVGLLAVLDWYPYRPELEPSDHEYLVTLLENVGCDPAAVAAAGPLDEDGARAVLLRRGHLLSGLDDTRLAALLAVFLANVRILREHTPGRYDGGMLLFHAAGAPGDPGSRPTPRAAAEWAPYAAGGIDAHDVPADHRRMLRKAAVEVVGPVLAAELDRFDSISR